MLTTEIKEQTLDSKELVHKFTDVARKIYAQNRIEVPCGYMTAEEWLLRSKKNISEIFSNYLTLE